MIQQGSQGFKCTGCAKFLDLLEDRKAYFLGGLRDDIKGFVVDPDAAVQRLATLPHTLIDLIDFLDPNCTRFSENRRQEIEPWDG